MNQNNIETFCELLIPAFSSARGEQKNEIFNLHTLIKE